MVPDAVFQSNEYREEVVPILRALWRTEELEQAQMHLLPVRLPGLVVGKVWFMDAAWYWEVETGHTAFSAAESSFTEARMRVEQTIMAMIAQDPRGSSWRTGWIT